MLLSVAHGSLTIGAANGFTVQGSGTASVTIRGTLAAVNAALAGGNLVYRGAPDHFGDDMLTVIALDLGDSGAGNTTSDTDHVPIRLNTWLDGTPQADSFIALPGNERIDGHEGIDTITFGFRLVDAAIAWSGNRVIVDGPGGSHTVLTGFERFEFTDGTVDNDDGNPLVDDLFYYAQNHDVWNAHVDAETHYAGSGWQERRDPNAFFSTGIYLWANPDIAAAGVNPLLHFHEHGWREGRVPSLAFDLGPYLAINTDVAAARIDPLWHFLATGAGEGRAPVAVTGLVTANGFDFVYYLQQNPDVAAAGVDPFWHFQNTGWKEGRNPNALFDTAGYLAAYSDVADADVNPLDHYNTHGWTEGRDPSLGFDTAAYLAANPDVAAAHVNPLLHFLQSGMHEGRSAIADGVWG